MTAQVAWQYPLKEYSFWGGNVVLLQNGDIEICASEPVAIGSTPPGADTPSQVLELKNGPAGPLTVWQMKVSRLGSLGRSSPKGTSACHPDRDCQERGQIYFPGIC